MGAKEILLGGWRTSLLAIVNNPDAPISETSSLGKG